jgi:hypothetical protein
MLTPGSNMRWVSSRRMMLAEHREALLAHKKKQMKIEERACGIQK